MKRRTPKVSEEPRRSAWIPWAFFAMFGIIIAANGIMVAVAFDSWTGLETDSAYQDGLAYNQEIAAAEAQRELGWQVNLSVAESGPRRVEVSVRLANAAGTPFKADEVRAVFRRPTHDGFDVETWLRHDASSGQHGGEVELPLAGIWDVSVEARSQGRSYRIDKRIEVTQ
jgi:nitrogen fixation protein FixH